MPPHICVVGSSNMDVIVRTPRFPAPGESLTARSMSTCAGGKGGNQAVMAARLGARVTMVGKIGRDAFGQELRRGYEAAGIDTSFLFEDRQPTGTAAVLVDDQGQNCILVSRGANGALTPRDVRKAAKAIRSADMVVCQFEVPMAATAEALRIAARGTASTMLNPSPFQPLPVDFPRARYLVPNETEFRQLTGNACKTDEAQQRTISKLWTETGATVIVTLGERGALVAFGPSVWREPAITVQTVDTSGAGDAFTGALAVFASQTMPFADAVRRALGVASLTVTRPGTQSSYPTRREAGAFLRANGLLARR